MEHFQVTICTTRDGTRTKRPAVDDVRVRSLVYNDSATRCSKARVYTLLQFTQTFSCRRLKHSHAVYTPLCSLCAREPRYSNLLVTCHKSSCFEANAAKSSDMDVMCGDLLLLHLHELQCCTGLVDRMPA